MADSHGERPDVSASDGINYLRTVSILARQVRFDKEDRTLIKRYGTQLVGDWQAFADGLRSYLSYHPETATTPQDHAAPEGDCNTFDEKQISLLYHLVNGNLDTACIQSLIGGGGGQTSYVWDVDPVRVAGRYRLYFQYLRRIAIESREIAAGDRQPLLDALEKVVFIGLILTLKSYWHTFAAEVTRQTVERDQLQAELVSILENIPQKLWSVEVSTARTLYESPDLPLRQGSDPPIPLIECVSRVDKRRLKRAWGAAKAGRAREVEVWVDDEGQSPRAYRYRFAPVLDRDKRVSRIDGLMDDITDEKRNKEMLRRLAITDELTGLGNRTCWYDRLGQAIAFAKRSGMQLAVLLLDLDGFKEINDAYGHSTGDLILCQCAARLLSVLRESDTVVRMGGDEFAVLLQCQSGVNKAAKRVADRIHSSFKDPFKDGKRTFNVSVSIGIAVYPRHGRRSETLMRRSDIAMYSAKRNKCYTQIYSRHIDNDQEHWIRLANDLQQAVVNRDVEVYYQPIVDMTTGETQAVEALARWKHPELGWIPPDQFIPIAEDTGTILPLTEHVTATALKAARAWRRRERRLPVWINLSAHCFHLPDLPGRIRLHLDEANASGADVAFEITETTLLSNIAHSANVLHKLSDMGIEIGIDDFGTGYSSLAYLKKLPLSILKVDQSFVRDMRSDTNDAAIVRAVIDLGHNLSLRVVAEGVEGWATWRILREMGCDAAQGYLVGRPMPAAAMEEWLEHADRFGMPMEAHVRR